LTQLINLEQTMVESTVENDGFWLNQYVNQLSLVQPIESVSLVLKTLIYILLCDPIDSID